MAALAVTPISSLAALTGSTASPKPLSYATLAAQVNTVFRVRTDSGQVVRLTLLKAPLAPPTPVKPGGPTPGDAGHEKFSLIFGAPRNVKLASAIHSVEHDQLGRMEFYLGEIGLRDSGSLRYEAVFNCPQSASFNPQPTQI